MVSSILRRRPSRSGKSTLPNCVIPLLRPSWLTWPLPGPRSPASAGRSRRHVIRCLGTRRDSLEVPTVLDLTGAVVLDVRPVVLVEHRTLDRRVVLLLGLLLLGQRVVLRHPFLEPVGPLLRLLVVALVLLVDLGALLQLLERVAVLHLGGDLFDLAGELAGVLDHLDFRDLLQRALEVVEQREDLLGLTDQLLHGLVGLEDVAD